MADDDGVAGEAAAAVDTTGVFTALAAACQGQMNVTALAQQLTRLGAYRGVGRENAVVKYSRHVLDALPKILTVQGGGETVGDQLSEKLASHSLLLQTLADCGAFPKLHASVLRCLFEDGQRLQALADVRELESKHQGQRRAGGSSPLQDVISAAGQACMPAVAGSGDRAPAEVFWACPSTTVAQFLKQVAAAAASAGKQPGAAAADLAAVAQLSKAVQVALGGAMQRRAHQQQWHGAALNAAAAGLDEPEWTAGADVRSALEALADACCRLHNLLPREAPAQHQDSVLLLFDLTDRLLNACAAAVAAAPVGQHRRLLHQAYAALRERLLAHLLQQAYVLCLHGDRGEGEHQLRRVEGLAEAHTGYPQLFDLADILGDREQLYRQMQQLRGDGLNPPLTTFVFGRLLQEGRHAELLELPPQFDAELRSWLGDSQAEDAELRMQLRWLHELRIGDYGGASAALAQLADNQQHGDAEVARLRALQKLAALAACPQWPLAAPEGMDVGFDMQA